MPTNTYVALATQTLSTTATSVTFSSIPQGYTDLVLITNTFTSGTATFRGLTLQIGNGTVDTGVNYSDTYLSGNGTAASSSRRSSAGYMEGPQDSSTTVPSTGIFNFMNYANTTTFKTTITRESRSNANVAARVNLWRSTSAINIITIYSPDLGSVLTPFAAGSTFSLYGIAAAPVWAAKATGGTITNDVQYTYHTFTASGTFTPLQNLTCDYLVVAGGGGGGYERGAGGGAGGLRSTVTATGGGGALETPLSLTATGYTVTVGGGGAGLTSGTTPNPGSDSVFGSITSIGGGGGGGTATSARNGGSGGGAWYALSPTSPGTGTANQGFAGGNGFSPAGGGGGGGAGAVGVAAISTKAGNGGAGVATSISGSLVTYAGGGGGAGEAGIGIGTGGAGGGGNGTNNASTGGAGTANTGGGGGGGGFQNPNPGNGGTGGSGIVIIRYAN